MDYKKVGILMAIGILVLLVLVMIIGPDQIVTALQTANIYYVLLAVAVQFIILILWNTRWGIICNSLDIPFKPVSLFAMTIIGLALNNLTPSGRSGGEPVRAYILSKNSDVDFKRTFASVMGDKMFDTLPFMVLAIFSIVYLMIYVDLGTTLFLLLLLSLLLFIVALAFIIVLCFNETIAINTVKWVFRLIKRFTHRADKYEETVLTSLVGFQNNLKYLLKDKRLLIIATSISFLVWFLELIRVFIVFQAFGVHVALGMIASVFLVSALIGVIPLLPGGLGSIDGVMILLYSMAGISASISTAATLIERMISLWMVLVLGVILLPFFGAGALDEI